MSQRSLRPVADALCLDQGFTLVDQFGAGAFKETFHVQLSDGSSAALKLFQQVNSPERTQREIDAMISCNHSNIATLSSLGTFQHGVTTYLFSLEEFLPGGTLTQKTRGSGLSTAEAFVIGDALISAVDHIASRGLVHRDLKPDNIMFRADGTPVIVDFGIVRDLSNTSLTQTWAIRGPGTPLYAAPEQLTNNKNLIDWRTDQFALAVLLSESTLGYHPYAHAGDDSVQTLERVAQRSGPGPRFKQDAARIGLPVLVRMAAPWPVGRYLTPQDLSVAWKSQVRGRP